MRHASSLAGIERREEVRTERSDVATGRGEPRSSGSRLAGDSAIVLSLSAKRRRPALGGSRMLNGRDAVRWLGLILVATLVPASAQEKTRDTFMAPCVH